MAPPTVGSLKRSVFARPAYRRLWAARTVSQWGDVVQFVTVALLVLHLTGSGLGISGAALAEVIPLIVLAPVAGTLVDGAPRVRVMVAADVARALLASVLAVFHGQVGVVYAVAFGLSAGAAFFNPAASSLLPSLVDDEQLVAANSGIWSAAVLSQVVLAPLGGILAATVGYQMAFAVNAASFAASAVLLSGLRSTEAPRPVPSGGLWARGRQGLAVIGRDRFLRAVAASQALAALSAGATSALLVVLVRQGLHASAGGYGLALAAIGAGAFLGPLIISRIRADGHHTGLIAGAFGLRGAVDLTLGSVSYLPVALVALVGYGLGTSSGNVSFSALLQRRVPDETRGRVFSAFDLIWHATRLVSIAAGGAAADAYGIRSVYFGGGSLLLMAAAAGLWALRWERHTA